MPGEDVLVRGGPAFRLTPGIVAALSAPSSQRGQLQRSCLAILLEHRDKASLPTSGRFVFYELVQRGAISKAKTGARRADQGVADALTALRKAGIVPWEWLVDETRDVTSWTFAATVADYVHSSVGVSRIDVWDGRPPPLVITESRSLAGVLRPMLAEYLCPVAATNGQAGGFLHTDLAQLLDDNTRSVLYLGDLDLSGAQIEVNTRAVLSDIVGREIEWERLALTEQQAQAYNIEPVIKADKRYTPHRLHEAIETEALFQHVIVDLVRDRLDEMLPEPLQDVLEREAEQRRQVAEVLGRAGLSS